MKLANIALVSTLAFFGAVATGCAAKTADPGAQTDGSLGTSEDQLVADNDEASDTDADLEAGVDDPLSGSDPSDPGTPPPASTSDADFIAKVHTNPGLFFKPAGCITSTVEGNKVTRVFNDCTGPYGLVHFNGTVVSTYDRSNGKLTVTHEATDFHINGATISGQRIVTYSIDGGVVTKTRTGDWTGTTAKGRPIEHKANFTSTYDIATKCITRDGTSTTSIGGREFDASISGYKRCGIGNLGCPESGEIKLSRTKNGDTDSVTIDFLGGNKVELTGPKGNSVTRSLVCRASS